jgi:hypothetical protein
MPAVKVTVEFTKSDPFTASFSNSEARSVVKKYHAENKIINYPQLPVFSDDGLVETRTLTFVDEQSFEEFNREDEIIENLKSRELWCKANNVTVNSTIKVE